MGNRNPRINYVLATWSGARRESHVRAGNLTYQHFQYLEKLHHGLSQITVGWPYNSNDSDEYRCWMDDLHGRRIGNATVVVERMKNEGRSYGQYSKIYNRHSDFDYFIFTEDDYVPVSDDFDTHLVGMYDEMFVERNCGYLCGFVEKVGFRKGNHDKAHLHAAVSWGVTGGGVLQRLCNFHGKVVYNRQRLSSQVAFSLGFTEVGYTLQDVLETYCCPYLKGSKIEYYGDSKKPMIIAPIQCAIRTSLFGVTPEVPFESHI